MTRLESWLRDKKDRILTPDKTIRDYQATFKGPTGEAVLEHLAQLCYINSVTYAPGDPYETAFREGQRRVLIHILNMLGTDPNRYMTKEEEPEYE